MTGRLRTYDFDRRQHVWKIKGRDSNVNKGNMMNTNVLNNNLIFDLFIFQNGECFRVIMTPTISMLQSFPAVLPLGSICTLQWTTRSKTRSLEFI